MPTLGAPLDFAKLEGRNFRGHQLGAAPSSPVTGQLYYNTGDNTLYWYDGTTWQSARGGSVADATTTSKGQVQLAGDLAGTAAAPQIAAGAIIDADVNAAAAIQESKLNLASDASVSTPSRRTLGAGAQQAMPGNRTLDAIANPVANRDMNGFRIVNVSDPTANADAATKFYVDNLIQGLDSHPSVRAASVANVSVAPPSNAPSTLDGVSLAAGDRVLLKDQTNQAQNGIYVVQIVGTGINGTWARVADQDTWAEVPGAYVWVEEGTTNADTGWVCTANQGGTLNTTNMPWVLFASASALIAGSGLTKTGNSIDVGAGTGISVATDTVSVDSAIIPRYYSSATHTAGTTITIPQSTHGCRASRGLIVMTVVEATGAEVLADVSIAANGDVTITFAASQGANTIRTTVVG
jgi:Repeat of unknown function (DUF5907)